MKSKVTLSIFFWLIFLYFPLSIEASSLNVLKVWKTNGQTETYYLTQKPKLTLSNEVAYLQVNNLTFEYPLYSYLKMTFEDSENLTDIQEIISDNPFEKDESNNENDDDSSYVIYDIHGKVIKHLSSSSNGHIGSLNLPTGIYIVKSNHKSFKIGVK